MELIKQDADASTALMYRVERPVYNEGYIEKHLLHKKGKRPKSIFQRLTKRLSCSSARAKSIVFSFLPILTWLPSYPVKEYLFGDLVSGMSTGIMQLPQGLAYAMLAAVPPVYGLYTSFYPVLLYTFFGTSRHNSIGTFAVVSLMVGGVVVREAPDSSFLMQLNDTNGSAVLDVNSRDARRVQIAVALTCMVGVVQSLIAVLKGVPTTNVATIILGMVCISFLFVVKNLNERFKQKLPVPIPGEFIVVIVSTGVSYGIQLSEKFEVDVVGKVPSGLLPPALPDYSVFPGMITDSIAIAVVAFSVSISLAKILALKHGYTVDGNQELIALGTCNFISSFFHCFTVTSSMSRTLVQEGTGGKTQIAGLLASIVVLIVVVAIGFVFQPLPQTALAAIVMVNLMGMFRQLRDIPTMWRTSRIEMAIWVVAFIASVLLGLDYGLLVALGFAILTVIYRTQSPKKMILGEIPDTGLYCDVEEYEEASEYNGIKIFRFNMSIYFANSDLYVNALKEKTGINPTLLLAAQASRLKKAKKDKAMWVKEGKVQAAPVKREALVKLDMEQGVTQTVVSEIDSPSNSQDKVLGMEPLSESDPDDSQNLLDSPGTIHSIILDFTPVNFIDSVGAKTIKSVIKEYGEVGVKIFLAGCSSTIMAELKRLQFFEGAMTPDLLFPSIHDAILHCKNRVRPQHPSHHFVS